MKALIRSKLVQIFIMVMLLAGAIAVPLSSSILPTHASFFLDSTYGNGGKVITSFGNDTFYGIRNIALQADGMAVAVGSNKNGGQYNWAIGRYKTDGSLDTSFGTNGIVTQEFGYLTVAGGVAIQPSDQKILVAGSDAGPWTVGRYNTDGSLDTSFGNTGITIPYTGSNSLPFAYFQGGSEESPQSLV
jgi:uncharacterized delta-60 repeat protein